MLPADQHPDAQQDEEMHLRTLGAFERAYDLWNREHPHHFCLAADLVGDVSVESMSSALRAVQRRHPLLAAAVHDTGTDLAREAPIFLRTDDAIPLRPAPPGSRWQDVVAQELAQRFVPGTAPLVRAVLVSPRGQISDSSSVHVAAGASAEESGPTLVLTFQHAIADGLAVIGVLQDLLDALNGGQLPPLPVPPSQEELLADRPRAEASSDAEELDPRLGQPSSIRVLTTPPEVEALAWSPEETARLSATCRARGVTVGGALAAAVARVLLADADGEFVRLNVPISLRNIVDPGGAVALHLGGTRVLGDHQQGEQGDVWAAARAATTVLAAGKSPEALVGASDAVAGWWDGSMNIEQVLGALVAANSFECTFSNLGTLPSNPIRRRVEVRALWGPAVLAQVRGEQMVGAVSTGGQLRMSHVGERLTPRLLQRVQELLL